jgi:cation diffusion facilitator CzcD-associated flavoprotein CzcO
MTTNGTRPRTPRVAIVGAGMSGLCMAIKLKYAGIDSFTIYEKASDLGGTWRDNTYPGLACDVPSRFYQYSFEPNPDWTHLFSAGDEIWRYLDQVADRYELRDHIRFNSEVVDARFQELAWQIETVDGHEATAEFLISATGVLHHPRYPDIDGLDEFEGDMFHSSRWDHEVALEGRRVAILGTGSTAVQIICATAEQAGELHVFQRTPQWVLQLPNPRYHGLVSAAYRHLPVLNKVAYQGTRATFELFARALVAPGWQRSLVSWMCRRNLATVKDPVLREALTPEYQPMCKRLVVSPGFYDAMQRENVKLVTDGIDRIEPTGIRTRDGVLHEIDVLVLATGFDAHAYMRPLQLTGEDGLSLDEAWSDGPRAYRTVAMPGFPNLFVLMGPHSPIGNYSLFPIAEAQADHALGWIQRWQTGEITTVAPTQEATDRFNAEMRAAMPSTVWVTGCQSWYLGKDGMPELWPWTPDRHRHMLAQPAIDDFHTTRPDGEQRLGTLTDETNEE